MPTRYLKSGIRDSDSLDKLSPLAETLFYRLLVTVDDFGRYDARPSLIKAHCFPIKDSVTSKMCITLLSELASAELIVIYAVDGKEYLQMLKWDNEPRAKVSKFPQMNSDCLRLHTDVKQPHTNLPLTVTVTETKTVTETPPNPRKRGSVADRFEEFWLAWPKGERKQDKAKCLDHWKRNQLDEHANIVLADVRTKRGTMKWREGYIEQPLVYLRGKRWEDGVVPQGEGQSEPLDWRESAKTIRAKGIEIGIGDWDEEAFHTGRGEPFPAYRSKVEREVAKSDAIAPDAAGLTRIAEIMGGKTPRK